MSYRKQDSLGDLAYSDIYAALTRRERFFFWLALVNFVIFVVLFFALGGNALNGTVRDGHYYFSTRDLTSEVSGPIFTYSILHTLSLFVTHPIAVVMGLKARRRAMQAIRRS